MVLLILIHVALFILYGCAEAEDIIGGHVVKAHSKPYMAFIYSGNTNYRCGGILIGEDYVLTAAHCAKRGLHKNIIVVLGAHNITAREPVRKVVKVCNAFPHPRYTMNLNDIMLLKKHPRKSYILGYSSEYIRVRAILRHEWARNSSKLSEAWTKIEHALKEKVKPNIYIKSWPINNISSDLGGSCSVLGWGGMYPYNTEVSPVLREVNVKVFPTRVCRQNDSNSKYFICAGTKTNQTPTGSGDSGGPLICGKSLSGILQGKQNLSLFIKVSPYIEWIINTMATKKCKH